MIRDEWTSSLLLARGLWVLGGASLCLGMSPLSACTRERERLGPLRLTRMDPSLPKRWPANAASMLTWLLRRRPLCWCWGAKSMPDGAKMHAASSGKWLPSRLARPHRYCAIVPSMRGPTGGGLWWVWASKGLWLRLCCVTLVLTFSRARLSLKPHPWQTSWLALKPAAYLGRR